MGHQIIQQPDGNFAVFSTVVDDWIITDATREELEKHYATEAAQKALDEIHRLIDAVEDGDPRRVYHQFAMTYDEANRLIERRNFSRRPIDLDG